MREIDQELFYAVKRGNLSRVERCIDREANVNTGYTILDIKPIRVAAHSGHKNVVEFFLSRGVSVNDTDRSNCTPLYLCSMR